MEHGYIRAQPIKKLSPKQVEVMVLVCNGDCNSDIAEALGITEATAKAHVSHIMRKIRVSNRVQILVKALQLRLITVKSIKKL